eukprot:981628-Pelagomonas_calceolata.AAC.2
MSSPCWVAQQNNSCVNGNTYHNCIERVRSRPAKQCGGMCTSGCGKQTKELKHDVENELVLCTRGVLKWTVSTLNDRRLDGCDLTP